MNLATEATETSGNAMANQEKYLNSYTGILQGISTDWKVFWMNVVNNGAVKGVVKAFETISKAMSDFSSAVPGGGLITALLGGSAALTGSSLITKGISDFLKDSKDKSFTEIFKDNLAYKGVTGLISKFKELVATSDSVGSALATVGKKAGSALLSFVKMHPIVTAIAAGFGALVLAFNVLIPSFDKLYKKAQSSATAFDESKKSVDDLNEQLDSTISKINEIQAKGYISLTDQSELDKLRKQAEYLQQSLEYEQKINEEREKSAVNDALSAYKFKDSINYRKQDTSTPEVYTEIPIVGNPTERFNQLNNLYVEQAKLDIPELDFGDLTIGDGRRMTEELYKQMKNEYEGDQDYSKFGYTGWFAYSDFESDFAKADAIVQQRNDAIADQEANMSELQTLMSEQMVVINDLLSLIFYEDGSYRYDNAELNTIGDQLLQARKTYNNVGKAAGELLDESMTNMEEKVENKDYVNRIKNAAQRGEEELRKVIQNLLNERGDLFDELAEFGIDNTEDALVNYFMGKYNPGVNRKFMSETILDSLGLNQLDSPILQNELLSQLESLSDDELKKVFDAINGNEIDTSGWGLEEAIQYAKEAGKELDNVINTDAFTKIFAGEQKKQDDSGLIDKFQTDANTIHNTLLQLQTGEFKENDITDLYQSLPKLGDVSGELPEALSRLALDQYKQTVTSIRNAMADESNQMTEAEIAAAEQIINSLATNVDLSGLTDKQLSGSIYNSILQYEKGNPAGRYQEIMKEFGGDRTALEIVATILADPSNAEITVDQLRAEVEDNAAYIQIRADEDDLKYLQADIDAIQSNIDTHKADMDYRVKLGFELEESDYGYLIKQNDDLIADLQRQIEIKQNELALNPNEATKTQLTKEIESYNQQIINARINTAELRKEMGNLPVDKIQKSRQAIEEAIQDRDNLLQERQKGGGRLRYTDYVESNNLERELEQSYRDEYEALKRSYEAASRRRAFELGNKDLVGVFTPEEQQALDDLENKWLESGRRQAQNLRDGFQAEISNYDFNANQIQEEISAKESQIDLNVSLGIETSEEDYRELISDSEEYVAVLEEEMNFLTKAQNLPLDILHSVYGYNTYDELQSKIKSVQSSIDSAKKSQIEWNNSIKEIPINKIEKRREGTQLRADALKREQNRVKRETGYESPEITLEQNALLRQDSEDLGEQIAIMSEQMLDQSVENATDNLKNVKPSNVPDLPIVDEEGAKKLNEYKNQQDQNAEEMQQNAIEAIDQTIAPMQDAIEAAEREVEKKNQEIATKKANKQDILPDDYLSLIGLSNEEISTRQALVDQINELLALPENAQEANPQVYKYLTDLLYQAESGLVGCTQAQIEWNQAAQDSPIEKLEARHNNNQSWKNLLQTQIDEGTSRGLYQTDDQYWWMDYYLGEDIKYYQDLMTKYQNQMNKITDRTSTDYLEKQAAFRQAQADKMNAEMQREENAYQRARASVGIPQLQDNMTDLQSEQAAIENTISSLENKNMKASAANYKKLLKNGTAQVANLKAQKAALQVLQGQYQGNAAKVRELQGEIDELNSSITGMESNMVEWQNQVNNITVTSAQALASAISAALEEMNSATGLTLETMMDLEKQFSNLEGHDLSTLFYRTAEGVKVDTDRMRELVEAQNRVVENDFADRIKEINDQMRDLQPNSDAYRDLQQQLQNVMEEQSRYFAQYKQQMEYLSKYNAIDIAESTTNPGEKYDKQYSRLKTYKENYDKGLVGTDEFQAYTAYLDEWGRTSAEAFKDVYTKASRYLTEDAYTGVTNLLKDMEKLGLATKDVDTGAWSWEFKDAAEAAHALGIGTEFFVDTLTKAKDLGGNAFFVDSLTEAQLETSDLTQQIYDATMAYREMEKAGASEEVLQKQKEEIENLEQQKQSIEDAKNNYIEFTEEARKKDFMSLGDDISYYSEQYTKAMLANDPELAAKYKESAKQAAAAFGLGIEETIGKNGLMTIGLDAKSKERYESVKSGGTYETPLSSAEAGIDRAMDLGNVAAERYSAVVQKLTDARNEDNATVKKSISTLKQYTKEQLESINLSDGQYDGTFEGAKEAEQALDALAAELGLTTEQAQMLATALFGVGEVADSLDFDITGFESFDEQAKKGLVTLQQLEDRGDIRIHIGADITKMNTGELESRKQELEHIKLHPEVSGNEEALAAINALIEQTEFQIKIQTVLETINESGGDLTFDELLTMKDEEIHDKITANVENAEEAEALYQYVLGLKENSNVEVPITVQLSEEQFNALTSEDRTINLTVNSEEIDTAQSKLDKLNNTKLEKKTVSVEYSSIYNAQTAVDSLSNSIRFVPSITINVNDSKLLTTISRLDSIITKINRINNSTIKPVTTPKTGNGGEQETPSFTGTMLSPAKVSGTAYNVRNMIPLTGAHASGDVGIEENQTSLVNELGDKDFVAIKSI